MTETTISAVISVTVVDSGKKVKDLLQTELTMGCGGRMGQLPSANDRLPHSISTGFESAGGFFQ